MASDNAYGITGVGAYIPRLTMEHSEIAKVKRWMTPALMNGFFDRDGNGIPCQVDGGLKCFGHPIGASGLRMAYEIYTQLLGRAGKRQINAPTIGLAHNLGGVPYLGVAAISIFGLHG